MKDNFESEEGGPSKTCPFCGSTISLEAVKCKVCHSWLNTKSAIRRAEEIFGKKESGKEENEEQTTEKTSAQKESDQYLKSKPVICPYCAEEIPPYAFICRHCHENIHSRRARRLAFTLHETEKLDVYHQPVWRMVVLSAVTLNFYQLFWILKNWKFIKVHMKLKVRMFLKFLYLFIPIVGLVSIYHQFRSINILAQRNEVPRSFSPLLIILVWSVFLLEGGIFMIFTVFGGAINLPLILITSIMGLLSVFPLTIVQETMNAILLDEKPGLKTRKGFSIYELFLILISLSCISGIIFYLKWVKHII
jgi:hypothetical protein